VDYHDIAPERRGENFPGVRKITDFHENGKEETIKGISKKPAQFSGVEVFRLEIGIMDAPGTKAGFDEEALEGFRRPQVDMLAGIVETEKRAEQAGHRTVPVGGTDQEESARLEPSVNAFHGVSGFGEVLDDVSHVDDVERVPGIFRFHDVLLKDLRFETPFCVPGGFGGTLDAVKRVAHAETFEVQSRSAAYVQDSAGGAKVPGEFDFDVAVADFSFAFLRVAENVVGFSFEILLKDRVGIHGRVVIGELAVAQAGGDVTHFAFRTTDVSERTETAFFLFLAAPAKRTSPFGLGREIIPFL
jgi:hypothetical protein